MTSRLSLTLTLAIFAPLGVASFAACGSSSSSTGSNGPADAASPQNEASTGPASDASSAAETAAGDAIADGSLDTGSDAPFVQAAHAPLPAIVYGGAPLLTAPRVVTITFSGDKLATGLEAFGAGAASTTKWWPTVAHEYCEGDGGCIGDGPTGTSAPVGTAPPAAIDDTSEGPGSGAGAVVITTYLESLMAKGSIPLPDDETIYSVFLPTAVNFNGGGSACDQGFSGYHSEGTYNGQNYVYALTFECAATLDDATLTAAHEIAESASDGLGTATTLGYYVDYGDPNTWGWLDAQNGEIGDLCDDYLDLGQDHWTEGAFVYQRIWSAKAAAASENPCLPVPAGEVYFNSAPATAFLEMDVGETITIEVDAFSDGPTSDWNILAQDLTDMSGSDTYVSLSFSGGTTFDGGIASAGVSGMNNGSKPKLAITLIHDPSAVQNGVTGPGEADVYLWSYKGSTALRNATAGRYWPMAIMTRGAAADAGITLEDGAVPEIVVGRRQHRSRGLHRAPRRPSLAP